MTALIWKVKEDSPREVRKEDLPDKDLPRTEDLPGKHIGQQTEEPVQDLREPHKDTDLPEKHTGQTQERHRAQGLQERDPPERDLLPRDKDPQAADLPERHTEHLQETHRAQDLREPHKDTDLPEPVQSPRDKDPQAADLPERDLLPRAREPVRK